MSKRSRARKNANDESAKNAVPKKAPPAKTFDEYRCTGNVEIDFPVLCAFLDVKNIPNVCIKHQALPITGTKEVGMEENKSQVNASPDWSKPCINVELENKDPLSAKKIQISGWKVSEQIFQVLQKMLPSVSQIQSLQFWQAGLTDKMVISLTNTVSLCSSLRVVTLEGNTLPEQSFHLLLSEGSILTHLYLRHNRIGDEGARLIGSALSTSTSANKNLLSLNLAFNSIGDAGAAHIAQGLKLNRTLLLLSLSSNQIGDSGAAHLAAILQDFPLTHEEVVSRRRLILQRIRETARPDSETAPVGQTDSTHSITQGTGRRENRKGKTSRKDEKRNTKEEKAIKKTAGIKEEVTPEDGKPKGQHSQEAELVEKVTPLLDQSVYSKDGQIFLPRNTLGSLHLEGNRITEKSLPLFLDSLEKQKGDGRTLLHLSLERNLFPAECECYLKIKTILALKVKPAQKR